MRVRTWLAVTTAGAILATGLPAFAQDTAPTDEAGLEDIIVTAQRREENLQRAAIAVSAVTGDLLRDAGVTRPNELTSVVPSLQVATAAGPYNVFYLRGVGNFNGNALSDSAIAFNVDGVYIGRPSSTTGFFYDLDRVEVVKGPQGTLYGRNATGGAINVITRKPRLGETSGDVTGEYGNYDAVRLDGAVNVPLGEKAAVRAAGIYVRHDGYLTDGSDDQKDWGARLSLRLDPTENLSIVVSADYFDQGGNGPGATPVLLGIKKRFGITSPQGQAFYASQPNTLNGRTFAPITVDSFLNNRYWGISSTIEWETSAGTITLIPSYREARLDFQSLASGFYIRQQEKSNQKSFEARFATSDENALRLLVGAFYFDEDVDAPVVAYIHQSNGSYQSIKLGTQSMAAFGRVTYAVSPAFRLTAGARYTTEDKDFSGFLQAPSRVCTRPTTFFPVYVPGCPNAAPIPYTPTPPAFPDFSQAATTGVITVGNVIDVTGVNAKRASFERVTYRLAADWDITPRNLLYASFETGFKSGGFFFSADRGVYDPEKIEAWTLGSKNRFFDNRLQLNLEAFYWRYKDQQISHLGLDSAGTAIFPTENVGRATMKGIEVESQFLLTQNTLLSANVQYLDAKYNDFVYNVPNLNGGAGQNTGCAITSVTTVYTLDCSGKRPPQAPKWKLNLGAQQTILLGNSGKIVANVRANFQTDTLTGLEFTAIETQKDFWVADASLTYAAADDRYFVTAFINNAFDKTVLGGTFPPPFAFASLTVATLRPPRTYGIRAGFKF